MSEGYTIWQKSALVAVQVLGTCVEIKKKKGFQPAVPKILSTHHRKIVEEQWLHYIT